MTTEGLAALVAAAAVVLRELRAWDRSRMRRKGALRTRGSDYDRAHLVDAYEAHERPAPNGNGKDNR